MSQPFSLGVNYWPRKKAMYWWSDFDAGEVDEEFSLIHEIGLNTVRIFLLWDDWMPTADTVSKERLDDLAIVCDMAEKHQLGLDITFFTGHMSGPNWSPGWMLDGPPLPYVQQLVSGGKIVDKGYRNYYTDPMVRQAQRLKLETIVREFRSHPAVWMWNLGNEPDLFAIAPDRETGKGWVDEMVGLIKSIDDQHPVTCGLHTPSLGTNYALRVDDTFRTTDVAVMHSYPMYTPWVRHPLDPDFVPYTCALTTALCGKPTLMEEFGGCTTAPGKASETWEWTAYGSPRDQFMASEEALAEYLEAVLPKLVEVGATGALTWCFADYVEELWDKPPCKESTHERFFGLVRPDGSLKPHAQVFKDFAATRPTVQPATRTVELDITPDEYYQDPGAHYQRLYEEYLKGF